MTTFTQALDQFRVSPSRDGARQVLQFCQARPERYAQLRDDDEAMIHFELTDDAADPMQMLAEHYAECWNALEDGGLEPTEEALWEVEEELAGGGWTVHRDDDDGRWKVSADEEFEAPRSVAYQRDGSPDRYEWITIGGHPEEPDKKHVGGFPVEIDSDGTILKSRAPGLQGKHISDTKGNIGKKKNVDQPDQTGVKPDQTGVKPESGGQETGSEPEEKPKWNAESTAIRHIAGSTGLEKNDVIAQIAQIAMKTGWGTAKIAGRIAKTLGKHALGTVGIGSGKRASMILDLVDDLLGKDNAVTNAAMGRNVDDKQSSAVLDAVDAMFGKDNPLSTAHHQVKPEKKKEKPKESSAVLDVVDAVLGKGNAVTNAVMNEGGGETSPQSSVLLDAVDAVAGKGNAVSNAASGIGGGSKQSSLLLDIWDSIAGKGNKVTDWLMRQEHDGKAYRRELLDAIDAAASECETEPTDAQKESGNYKKGHVTIQGLPITIENPKGSIRRGKGWQTKMKAHYGYVKRTESEADGDHVDVFIGPDPQSEIVFVVDQLTKGGRFDEHKCILPGQHLQGNILAASKSIYSGKAIKLRCASGNTLSVTPNHPVMTLRGLVAAGDLREGDNLLAYVGKSELAASRDDEKYVPTVVEKVFGTLKKLNPLCFSREFVSALDFHGDAKFFNGKIDVVRANSKLGSDNESDFSESFTHQNLVGSLATPTVLTGDSSFHSCFETVDPASIRRSGNISDSFSSFGQLSGSETGDFESYRFGETSDVDLALLQSIGDDANINVISDSEILGRLPINVSLDEIIGIDVVHYDGPVYDFRSTTGLIVVNRLVISNCMIGYTSAKDAKEGYLANYSPGWTGYGGCKAMPMEVFKEWIKSGDTGSKVQSQKIEYARVRDEFVPANMADMGEDWHNQLKEINSLPDEAAQQKAKEINDRLADRTETLYRNIGGKQERYTVKNPGAHSFVKSDNGWVLVRKYSVVSMREMGEDEEEIQKHEQDGEVLRYETIKWKDDGKSKSGKQRWKHPTTGEVRYQPKMPGDKSGRKKAVRTGEGTPKPKKAKATKTVDKETLREKLQPYDGGLNEVQSKSAKASFKALMRHHSDKVTSRLSELVDDAFAGLGKAKTEEARQKWTSKLGQYRQMLEWAGAGVKESSVQTEEWGTDKQPFYRPGVNPTVDNIITRDGKNGEKEILLIQRKEGKAEGGKWALPGGFHDTSAKKGEAWKPGHETAKQAALRELAEETGLDAKTLESQMEHIGDYEGNGRDPRDNEKAWSKSSAFKLHLTPELAKKAVAGLDDASDAKWVPLSKLKDMSLAFDHGKIIEDASYQFPTASEVKAGTDLLSVRKNLIQRVIAKFGGDEHKYSSYSTEQLRKMLEAGVQWDNKKKEVLAGLKKGETNDDTNSSQLDGDGKLSGGGGEDAAGSTVGTDAGQASTGVLPESGNGDGGSLSGLPDGEGQPGAGASAVPGIGEGDGTARGEGGSSEGASTGAGGTGGSSGGSGTEGDRSGGVPDVPGSDGQTKQVIKKKPTAETPTDLAAGNFRYTDTQAFMQGGLKTKFQRNIEAIRTLKMLQEEGRQATPAEQEILSKFIGWGQFPAAFERGYGDDQIGWQEKEHLKKYLTEEEWDARFAPSKWEKEKELLKSLLTDEEYKAARKSTLNAHYTHPDVVKAHWKMAERLGFKGGKFLETSAGAGYYMGMMPGELAGRTRVNAVELDPITAAICKQLYPKANVENTGFEKFANPDGFYELVASNVPFGDYSIFEKRYAKYGAKIHDHFFLKSLDLAKPGGLVMHVTSTGTLDKQDATIRKALAEGAEFVGAVRFPGSTHKKNAGTEVVTDMVILRKKNPKIPPTTDETPKEAKPKGQGFTGTTIDSLGRLYYWQDGKRVPGPSWLETTTVPDPAGGDPIPVNKYFADHPEQVLGTLDRTGTMYRADSKNVSLTDDFEARLEAAIQRLPEGAMRTDVDEPEAEKVRADDHTGKENSLVSKDGKIYVYQNGMLTEQKTTKEERQKIEQLLAIRDARNLLVANQIEGTSSAESRKKLNELYDAYVAKNGIIHSKKNMDLMGDDPDLDNLLALERYDKKTKKATKADMLVKDTIRSGKIVEKAENITEAVGVSLHMHGLLDVGYMSKILGMTKDEVGGLLAESGLAFNDPKEGWKQNDQYLSGNVRKKLIEAKAAAAVDPAFRRNVEALEAVQPADIPYDQITIKMGARWVPETDMQNFAVDLFGGQADMYEFRVNPIDSKWSFDIPKNYNRQRLLNGELAARWGTDRVGPSTVLNAALNNTLITVSDKDSDGKSYVNKEATDAANEKVKNMRDQFSKEFVWEDEERRERLSRYYNDNFNNIVPIKYDGSHQTFPGQNAAWKLYPHQKDAVWQIVTTGKGLLAHEVGTGKSATMFTSAMELRRLGLAKKPAIVCLKTNIAALTEEARQLYPGAKILSTLDSFDAKSRKKTMAQIATGDYDMVFMTHEHLGFMKMKPDTQKAFLQKELDQIMESMAAAVSEHGNNDYSVKQLEAAALKVTAKMQSSMDDSKKDDTVYFEDSGIDQIMVDEAHYFKNLGVYSKNQIKGIPTATSDRALDMYMRSSWLMEKNNGRGVVFATGTPVSNSMAELYVMQKYLQEKELKESGINNFDDWANMYGDTQTKQEYTMTGEYKPVTRFSEFTNVPELLNQARQVMDVVRVDSALDEHGKPTVTRPERKDAAEVAPPLPNTAQFLASLQSRARSLGRDRKADNMLKICTDAKKFSVDMRLIDQNAEDYPESKVNILVNKTIELWKQHPDKVQFIFSDAGVHETDTNSFTCYDDITQKLIDAGIPADKIKNFGKIDTEKQKEEAVQALKSGEALIAIGGTKKLGTGVNAQNKMIAIHHLDVPMKPAEIEQREGRGWRSGNQNKEINIIKYVAQPMDQFFWGLVSRKDKFIKKVIIDKNPPRNIEELEDADDLSPDRLAAIASGNPLRVRQVELEYDEKKLADSERRHTTEQRRLVASEKGSLAKIARLEEEAKKSRKLDQELPKKEEMPTTVKVGDKEYDNQKEADEALKARIAETANLNSWEEETIGEYAGMPIIRKQNRDFSQGIRTYIETPIGEIPFNDSIQSLKLKISGARNDYKNTELAIEEVKKGMAKVKESVGKPYANAEKLATIRAELKKIAEELAPKKDEDTTTVTGSGSAALDDYLKDVKKDGGEDPRGQTIIKKPQAVIPPASEFTSIHDVDTRVKSFGKAIKAPTVKVGEVTGHEIGPFVVHKKGEGKNTRYIVTHKGTGLNAATADSMSVANVAAHAMSQKGDWNFTDGSKFGGEAKDHGMKVIRAVSRGNMQDLADLAGIGEHTVQRNQRMPWNFKSVLSDFRSSPDADGARKVLRYCAADVSRYAMIEDADAANIEYELTPEEGGADHFRVLAEFYADHWNQLERAGLEPSNDGLSKAADELANGDWVVFFDEDDMEWRVIHAEAAPHVVKYAAAKNLHTYSCPRCKGIAYADSPVTSGRFNGYAICSRCGHSFATVNRHQAVDEVLYYAARKTKQQQAPPGGATINGQFYRGGKFIPSKEMAKATPQERKALDAKTGGAASKASGVKWNAASKRKSSVQTEGVSSAVKRINNFLDNQRTTSYQQIEELAASLNSLSVSEIKEISNKLDGPQSAKTKEGLIRGWANWMRSIKLSDDESASRMKNFDPESYTEIKDRIAKADVAEATAKAKEATSDREKVEAEIRESFDKLPEPAQQAVSDVIEKNKESLTKKIGDVSLDVLDRTLAGVGGIGMTTLGVGLGAMSVSAVITQPMFAMMGWYDGLFDAAGLSLVTGFKMLKHATRWPGTAPEKKEEEPWQPAEEGPDDYRRIGVVLRYEATDEDARIKQLAEEYYTGIVKDLAKVWKPEWSEKKERYSLIDLILRYAMSPRYSSKKPAGNWVPVQSRSKTQKWVHQGGDTPSKEATPKAKVATPKSASPSAKATTPGAGKAVSPKQVAKASAPKSPPVAKKEAVKWNAASKRKKADPKAKILELAKGMTTASIPEIRAKMPVELRGKEFDDAIIALADDRKIQVHSDALPESFSPEERANLTSLGNNVFTSFSVTPSVGMDMVNKSAIPEEAKKEIGELHNEFMKMDPEQQQRILQNLEAAARKYDQKQNLSKFVSTRAYAGLSPSQRKNAEEAFMILDPEQQAEQLEVLKSMTPEQIDDAVRQANELDRQKHNTKPDTITWGGVKGGRFKPEELKYDEDEDLTQMSEDDLWNAFVGEQGGNPHLPKHQWTPRAHKLMDAWRKKSDEVEAAAKQPAKESMLEKTVAGVGDFAKKTIENLNPLNMKSHALDLASNVVDRIDGGEVGRVIGNIASNMIHNSTNYQRGGVLRHFHQGLVLRYEWVEVPTKAKTKKWKDSATGRTRYQPTQPGVGRGGGIMSKGVQATATTGGTITRTKERGARGQVDREKLKQLLEPHGHHELDEKTMKKTKSQFRALAGHHKELVHHRLEELANGMQSALEKLPDNAQNRETRQEIGRKLRAISHMTEWADAKHPQQTKKEPSVGKLSSKINSGKFNLAERGKGLKPSELKQYPVEKQEMKHADPVMQKHQDDHDAYLEAQAKKTIHVQTGADKPKKSVIDPSKSMWDLPGEQPLVPKNAPQNMHGQDKNTDARGWPKGTESWAEPAPAKSSVQTEPAKPKSGWNEPQKRVKQVHDVAEKVATGKASKKDLDDVTRAINDRLKPADKPTFWKRVVKGIKNKAALAMVLVSMWGSLNAGIGESKEIAAGKKDPIDKSALAFELHKRAEGMAGKPREQRPGIVKTTYQRAE